MSALGRHILVEFSGCNNEIMNDVSVIEKGMVEAAQKAGATVIQSTFHHFSPYGVSGVVVIQESHLAIHTWPEYGYAAVDLFTCGDTVDPWISFDHLKQCFQAQNHSAIEMYRGSLNLLNRSDFQAQGDGKAPSIPNPKFTRTLWFTDRDDNQALSIKYNGDCLYNQKSPYQSVRVFDTAAYGRMLTLDSCVMVTERDERHYHEMLVHPAMQMLQHAERVLVIGGGDGGTIREVFRYPFVKKVEMVEIDQLVVDAAKKFLPTVANSFDNPKLELRFEDGIEFVKNAPTGTYDLVIVDGADPIGPAEGLFSEEFYRNCQRILKPQGIVVAQGESPMFHEKAFAGLYGRLATVFGAQSAFAALFFAPSYPSGMWSIQMGVKGDFHPLKKMNFAKVDEFVEKNRLHYYSGSVHQGAFALPRFVNELLAEGLPR